MGLKIRFLVDKVFDNQRTKRYHSVATMDVATLGAWAFLSRHKAPGRSRFPETPRGGWAAASWPCSCAGFYPRAAASSESFIIEIPAPRRCGIRHV